MLLQQVQNKILDCDASKISHPHRFSSSFPNNLIILNYTQLKVLLAYSVVHFDIKPQII
jgi:hypothetical protein